MADNEVAIRAPESDAQEDSQEQKPQAQAQDQANPQEPAEESVFPGDTRAQEGPSMGVSRFAWLQHG